MIRNEKGQFIKGDRTLGLKKGQKINRSSDPTKKESTPCLKCGKWFIRFKSSGKKYCANKCYFESMKGKAQYVPTKKTKALWSKTT